jgi:N4-bis(aminopropyl)spermidine synthase
MASDESPGSSLTEAAGSAAAAAAPISALAELVARYRPDSRRLRHLVALLTGEPLDTAALVQRSGLPRPTVESVLSAVAGDLVRDGDKALIRASQVPAYRQRFGYDQLARTELADPLADRLAAAAAITASMTALIAAAPRARTDLDHMPATPETTLRRALWLDSTYDLAGAVLLFVGDHDLTSLAVAQVSPGTELVVVDIDEATLEFIDTQAARLGVSMRCLAGDLRFGLPERALGCADLVFTDPPYTPEGVELFASRGLQGLGNRDNGRVIVAYGFSDRHPSLGFGVQSAAHRLGLAYEAVLPRFSRYDGAQAVGSASALYVWRPTTRTWRVLDRPGNDGAPGIYTRGPQATEKDLAAFEEIPAAVHKVTSEAGFPVGVLVGSGWGAAREKTARLRLGTLLSGGLPPGSTAGGRSALVADLSGDPGPWLLRTLLAANSERLVALVPNRHPDLASEAAQNSLTALLRTKYRLRFLRSQPDAQHAIVLAEAAAADTLDPPGRLARRILRRAHGKVGNAWREGLIDASRELGDPLTKRDARAAAEASARQPDVLDTRLIDLPRHQIARVLEDAAASAVRLRQAAAEAADPVETGSRPGD